MEEGLRVKKNNVMNSANSISPIERLNQYVNHKLKFYKMKKQIALLLTTALLSFTAVNAQGGGQRLTPEERTKATMEKLAPLNLDADATKKTEAIFADYNITWQKTMDEMRASGSVDRDAMMAKRKEQSDARDVKLKAIFSADQMNKWKEEIEPTTRQQRPPSNN